MKKVKISSRLHDKYALVDDEDFDTVSKYKWFISPQGYVWASDYSDGWRNKKTILLHRLILPVPPGYTVDHKDRNPLNNQRFNLRQASYSQNNMNTKTRSDNTSGHRGVYWEKRRNKWRVCINFKSRQIHVGQFSDKHDAIQAYQSKARELYGEYAS